MLSIANIDDTKRICGLCKREFIPIKKGEYSIVFSLDSLCVDCNITLRKGLIKTGHQILYL